MTDPDFESELRHDGADDANPLAPAETHLAERLKRAVGAVAQGAAADVERYAAEMSVDLALAASLDDERALRHLAAQAKNLGEKHRLSASRAGWEQISEVTFDLGQTLAVGLSIVL